MLSGLKNRPGRWCWAVVALSDPTAFRPCLHRPRKALLRRTNEARCPGEPIIEVTLHTPLSRLMSAYVQWTTLYRFLLGAVGATACTQTYVHKFMHTAWRVTRDGRWRSELRPRTKQDK